MKKISYSSIIEDGEKEENLDNNKKGKLAKERGEIKKRKRKIRKNWKWEIWMLENGKEIKEYIKR